MGDQGRSTKSLCFNLLFWAFDNKLWMCWNPREPPTSPVSQGIQDEACFPFRMTLPTASETKGRVLGQSGNILNLLILNATFPLCFLLKLKKQPAPLENL